MSGWDVFVRVSFAGNEAWRWVAFFGAVLGALVLGRLARYGLGRLAAVARSRDREFAALFLESLAKSVVLLAAAAGVGVALLLVLNLNEKFRPVAESVCRVFLTAAFGYAVYRLVDLVDHYLGRFAEGTQNKVDDMLVPLVGRSIRITILALVILQVATAVSGRQLTTILAGLGVGGLALALAAQDSVKNFFGSLVILADKPFQIGERVVIGGHDGVVEQVGFRSTRLRRLDGHLVTVPNGELVNATLENIGRRPFIKRVANITITYDTPPEKVAEAVAILKEILADHEGMDPDYPPRVYFSDFNDWSLNIIVFYWYHPPEYWQYCEFTERVNMEILKRFNDAGIDFAFPSQTVFLANDDQRQLAVRMLRDESGDGAGSRG